jgi:hypothetical protein
MKMNKNGHGPMYNKGARDPSNFGKGEAQQKPNPVVNKGARDPNNFGKGEPQLKMKTPKGKSPSQFMKVSKGY